MTNSTNAFSILLKTALALVLAVVLFIEVRSGYKVYKLSDEKRTHKMAYAFVNNVSFGLLSVDVWRNQVVETARQELGNFKLTPEQEQDIKKEIDNQLHTLVDGAFAEIEKPKKSIGDKLKKAAVKSLVDKEEVDREIPGFSKRIMGVLTKPSSYKRITNIADTTISKISRKIYDSSVAATAGIMDSIYRTYGAGDKASFELKNEQVTNSLSEQTKDQLYWMTGCAVFMCVLWIILRRRQNLRAIPYVFAALGALALLVVGVSTTIIEIDASLAKMDIRFLSGALSFRSQSLFFQSQSILDVIRLLVGSGGISSTIVGIMIAIFCIAVPVIILAATSMVVIKPNKWPRDSNVDYFAFHAEKWNMSNVLMVAILMTYIGFNGIVDSTLTTLNYSEGSITSVTSNNTAMEPGYYVYIAFVAVSTALVTILKRTRKRERRETELAAA